MRQVPPSPIQYLNPSETFAIVQAMCTHTSTASVDIASAATRLYAEADPLSRHTIQTAKVDALVQALIDLAECETLDLEAVLHILRSDEDQTRRIMDRASALYHEAMYAGARHTAANGLSYEEWR